MRASEAVFKRPFEVLTADEGFQIDIRYASARNFTGRDLYHGFNQVVLHEEAADKFRKAIEGLHQINPRLQLLVLDALRPHSVQVQLYEFVKNTPMEHYVAHPDRGSVHNYGFAIDLTIVDESKEELDMGTEFDFFGDLAEPRHEPQHLADGSLSQTQHQNRLLLRKVMTHAGFHQLSTEWWHFNARPIHELKELGYPRVDLL